MRAMAGAEPSAVVAGAADRDATKVGADTETETGAGATVEANQQGRQYQSIFDPGNLGKQVESAPEHD